MNCETSEGVREGESAREKERERKSVRDERARQLSNWNRVLFFRLGSLGSFVWPQLKVHWPTDTHTHTDAHTHTQAHSQQAQHL